MDERDYKAMNKELKKESLEKIAMDNDREKIEWFIERLATLSKYGLTIYDTELRKKVKEELISVIVKIEKILDDE